ncbi:MAG: nucleoside phosphorylase [Ruminiclostridium sp.]
MSEDYKKTRFHLQVTSEQVGKYVILPGDPGRVPEIAKYLDNAVQIAENREFNTYTGTLLGEKVSVVSTGIGGPSAAIAMEELIRCGAHTFIRIGTSGGIDLNVMGGDLCIASAAVRAEGTSREYIPIQYPAVANFDVVFALRDAAAELSTDTDGNRYHVGVVHSKDSFYGEVEPEQMPIGKELLHHWKSYVSCGCLTSEMECAALFSVAIARRVRAGAVLTAIWNVERANKGLPDRACTDTERGIKCAVGAIKRLIEMDRKNGV